MSRRVLVTRRASAWPALAARCARSSLIVELTPTTVQVDPEDPRPAEAALASLADIDWIVLTSGNGVRFLMRDLEAKGIRDLPGTARIAAVGAATARAVTEAGRSVDLIAEEAGGAWLAGALAPHVPPGARVLVVRPEGAHSAAATALRAAGAEVVEAPLYRTIASEHVGALTTRAVAGEFAGVAFTAPSSLSLWLEAAGPRRADLASALAKARRIAIGRTTAASLASAALVASEVAASPDESAVGDAIVRALATR